MSHRSHAARTVFALALTTGVGSPFSASEGRAAGPTPCDWLSDVNRQIHPTEAGQHIGPDIATGPGGMVGAAWAEDHAAGGYHIFYTSSTDGGVTWSVPEMVDTRTSGSYSIAVDLDFTPSGMPIVVWEDDRVGDAAYGVYLSKRDPAGGGSPWTRNVRVNAAGSPPSAGYGMDPSLAVLDETRYFVAWTDWREGDLNQVYCRRTFNGGASWGAETRISDELGDGPVASDACLVVDPRLSGTPGAETLYCVMNDWRGFDPGEREPNVYFYRSTNGGASWSIGLRVNDIEPDYQWTSSHGLVVLSDGSLAAGWMNSTSGLAELRSSVSTTQGSSWSSSARVSPDGAAQVAGGASIACYGTTVFAAFDVYETDWNAYSRVSQDGGLTWGADACRIDDDTSGAVALYSVVAAASTTEIHHAWQDSRPGFGAWKIYTTRVELGTVSVPELAGPGRELVTCNPNPSPRGAPLEIQLSGAAALPGARIAIYDVAGRCVATLSDQGTDRGLVDSAAATRSLTWDGLRDDGASVPPGAYWVRVEAEGALPLTGKLVRVR